MNAAATHLSDYQVSFCAWVIPKQIIFILSSPDHRVRRTANHREQTPSSGRFFPIVIFEYCLWLYVRKNLLEGEEMHYPQFIVDMILALGICQVSGREQVSTQHYISPTKHSAIWTAVISQLSLVRNIFIISLNNKTNQKTPIHFSQIHLLHYYLSALLEVLDQLMEALQPATIIKCISINFHSPQS